MASFRSLATPLTSLQSRIIANPEADVKGTPSHVTIIDPQGDQKSNPLSGTEMAAL
jgi:hypothetical protein